MIIRHIKPGEEWKPRHIMGCCFNYSVDAEAEKDKPIRGYWYLAFADDDETLMSAFDITEFTSYYCGSKITAAGVGGVSTYPEFRRSGGIRALLGAMFKEEKAKGRAISVLFPFSYRYYRKFGYEVIMNHKTIHMPMSALSAIPRNTDGALYKGEKEKLDDILSVYNAYASKRNICTFRNDGKYYPSDPVKEQKYTYIWYENGKPVSSATVKPAPDSTLEITELVYTSASSVKGIFGYLRMYEGAFKNIIFDFAEEDTPIPYCLGEDWEVTPGTFYGVQARVLDFEKIFSLNKYPENPGRIRIKLYGDALEENNGVYTIDFADGKGSVSLEPDGEYDVSLPVHSLSRLVLGAVPSYNAEYLDGIEIKNPASLPTLTSCFPKRPINLFERC